VLSLVKINKHLRKPLILSTEGASKRNLASILTLVCSQLTMPSFNLESIIKMYISFPSPSPTASSAVNYPHHQECSTPSGTNHRRMWFVPLGKPRITNSCQTGWGGREMERFKFWTATM